MVTVEGAMAEKEVYSKASDVSAENGVVNVDGPDGVDVGLTPEFAEYAASGRFGLAVSTWRNDPQVDNDRAPNSGAVQWISI